MHPTVSRTSPIIMAQSSKKIPSLGFFIISPVLLIVHIFLAIFKFIADAPNGLDDAPIWAEPVPERFNMGVHGAAIAEVMVASDCLQQLFPFHYKMFILSQLQ